MNLKEQSSDKNKNKKTYQKPKIDSEKLSKENALAACAKSTVPGPCEVNLGDS